MEEMIRCIKLRLGLLLWSLGLLFQAGLLCWEYRTFLSIQTLKTKLFKTKGILNRASLWKIQAPLQLNKLIDFSQELKKYAAHFDEIEITYKNFCELESYIELTIRFKVKHDDIFWNFFKTLYTYHKGRIESIYLSLSREKEELLDQDTSLPSFPKNEASNLRINGLYTARYYCFTPEG